MKTIHAVITRASDGTFGVMCQDAVFTGMGESIAEAKSDMEEQIHLYVETAVQRGLSIPAYLSGGDFIIEYIFDYPSLMKYYVSRGFLSLAGMSKLTGINQKQLWSYLNGTRPRKSQAQKIERGLRSLSQDLASIF